MAPSTLTPEPAGEWVKYEDHQAEVERLRQAEHTLLDRIEAGRVRMSLLESRIPDPDDLRHAALLLEEERQHWNEDNAYDHWRKPSELTAAAARLRAILEEA